MQQQSLIYIFLHRHSLASRSLNIMASKILSKLARPPINIFGAEGRCDNFQIRGLSKLSPQVKKTEVAKSDKTQSQVESRFEEKLPALPDSMPKVDRPVFYHEQMEWLDDRQVRISKPSKNVMQSGTAYTNGWKIEFDSQPRWENWLMGWTSTADPVSNLSLSFPTKEDAITYCEKNKLQWFVEEQPERKMRRKSYADNFSWNKRTRLGSK